MTLSTPKAYGNGEIPEVETSVETSVEISETTQVEVLTEGKCAIYYGTADSDFKSRHKNHNMSFRHKNHLNDIELSKYWYLHNENIKFDLNWSVTAHASP